jgi:hypothetical protein
VSQCWWSSESCSSSRSEVQVYDVSEIVGYVLDIVGGVTGVSDIVGGVSDCCLWYGVESRSV